MRKPSLSAIAVAALAATGSNAFAQGYGSAAGTAYTLGATASPAYAGSRNSPAVAQRAEEPLVTGALAPRERAWSRLRRR
ncbi:MAG: hypothetical protein PGN25_11760 [Methylorubrum populi]